MRKWKWLLFSFFLLAAALLFYKQTGSSSDSNAPTVAENENGFSTQGHGKDRLRDLKRPDISASQQYDAEIQRELAFYLDENPLPASMQGAAIDGQLRFDKAANLIHEYGNRSLFDQLLSLQGEWTLPEIERWLYDYALIAANYTDSPEVGAEQVLQAFGRYVEYLKAADELYSETAGPMPVFTADSFEDLYNLRRKILGEQVAELYFSREENYTRTQLELADIRTDKSLSDEERLKKLNEWSRRQPTHAGREMRETLRREYLRNEVEKMRKNGASSEEIFKVRAREFGVEAAARLESMDIARDNWRSTVDSFRSEVERIRELDEAEEAKTQMINSLLSNYGQAEQRRLRALVL